MGAKRRLYQVAKQYDVSNDTLIQYLAKLNFDIRNHMSPVSSEMIDAIEKKYGGSQQPKDADYEFRKRLKEKRAQEAAKAAVAQKELEQRLKAATQFMTDKSTIVGRDTKDAETHESVETFVQDTKSVSTDENIHVSKASKARPEVSETPVEKKTAKLETTQEVLLRTPDSEPKTKSEAKKEKATVPVLEDKKLAEKTRDTSESKKRVEKRKEESSPRKKDRETTKSRIEAEPKKIVTKEKAVDKDKIITPAKIKARAIAPDKGKPATGVAPTKEGSGEGTEGEVKKKRRRRRRKKKPAPILDEEIIKSAGDEKEDEFEDVEKKFKRKPARKAKTEAEGEKEKSRDRTKKKKKKKRVQISEAEVDKSIKKTLASMESSVRSRKRRKKSRDKDEEDVEDELENLLRINEFVSVSELATAMEVEASDVIKKCLELGMMVSINQRLDKDVLETVADEFGFEVEILPEYGQDILEELEEDEDDEENVESRPPVVTIMGHVDHGKTSLLDHIRESNIIAGEAGGITQHIGAYEVNVNGKSITFLDTPGHEAFTAMRARGAQITDIVILIVAADDAVMPQTIEAINHAQAAHVPIIVAINKIDKANSNIELIKKQLADHNVLIEEWGGKYQCAEISAKEGTGIPKLLEMVLIEAEVLELKANYERLASGVIIESRLDKGKGVVATVLVQRGTLKVGSPFIVGQFFGKVRSLFNERNQRAKIATPSMPIQVVGFSGLPAAGDSLIVLKSEKDTREISLKRQQIRREQEMRRTKHLTLDEISRRIKQGSVKDLTMIVKGDVDGSVEALSDSLIKLSNAEVAVKVIHKGVGAISESDVLLASASDAIIVGFHVRPTLQAREVAKRENVDIRQYTVIYDAISEVKSALEGMLEPETSEEIRGTIEVRQIFKVPKVGTIAGCHVLSGKVARNDKAKLYRNDKLIFDGKINSLRRFKEDAKEVTAGFECGIGFEGFQDIHISDIIEPYKIIQVKRTLASL